MSANSDRVQVHWPKPFFWLLGQEAHRLFAHAPGDYLFETHKRATADKQDIRGIDGREFLMRMLASALRRNIGYGPFENL